jgi:hypothetical protein
MILSVQESAVLRALAQFASTKEHERASECLEAIADALGVTVDFERGTVASQDSGDSLQVNLCIVLLHVCFGFAVVDEGLNRLEVDNSDSQ